MFEGHCTSSENGNRSAQSTVGKRLVSDIGLMPQLTLGRRSEPGRFSVLGSKNSHNLELRGLEPLTTSMRNEIPSVGQCGRLSLDTR